MQHLGACSKLALMPPTCHPRLQCLQVAGMLAMDGRCKTLDAAADGYVRAEAAIVIRIDPAGGPGVSASSFDDPSDSRLTAASLMAGSFVNQDGRSSSLTAPNGPSQQQVPQLRVECAGMDTSATASIAVLAQLSAI